MGGNRNLIVLGDWSNPSSRALYEARWPGEPQCQTWYQEGRQCGGCSFFAPLDSDWGLCAHPQSRHRLETVFEHFTCPSQVREGWGPHSFSTDPDDHCVCGGDTAFWRPFSEAVNREDAAGDGGA